MHLTLKIIKSPNYASLQPKYNREILLPDSPARIW